MARKPKEHKAYTIDADALAPGDARASVAMVLAFVG